MVDGGTLRFRSCSAVRSSHFIRKVARWKARNAISISRSAAVGGGKMRSVGMAQVSLDVLLIIHDD